MNIHLDELEVCTQTGNNKKLHKCEVLLSVIYEACGTNNDHSAALCDAFTAFIHKSLVTLWSGPRWLELLFCLYFGIYLSYCTVLCCLHTFARVLYVKCVGHHAMGIIKQLHA